ncbi:hypothetical protein [cf. Phormidesmis sp. LEGE 11477]|uniref:hypothetical protein n=1 Tax=cf. Phormidesmis sp. LEGE 11477 TaxID=1828680 RepID=UPI00187E4A21|nr:hypothetical protein [cf. Phormidesmis sp. LEGE 11477]MBE9062885.1 hypothetical protein [cf. Phormidesmis sp. LEGE 11477]
MTYTGGYRSEPSSSRERVGTRANSIRALSANGNKCRFTLALEPDANAALDADRSMQRLSKTSYINRILDFIKAARPVFFGGSILDELGAYAQLSDSISKLEIPELAAHSRRNTLQQVLFLLEKGLQQIEKEKLDD